MNVVLASSNLHKTRELQRLWDFPNLTLVAPQELGLDGLDVIEDGITFEDNARKKATAYLQAYRMPVLADDSGISVDALAGAPGVRSARFGRDSFNDEDRTEYLLESICTISPPQRGAHYTCTLILAFPDGEVLAATGYCYGSLAERVEPGPTGFGYDPIFIPAGYQSPLSLLGESTKDCIGHRGRALAHLRRLWSATSAK